jgi:hypothetical protein
MPADRFLHTRAGKSVKVSMLTDLEYRVWTQYLLSADDFGVMRASALTLQAANDHLANRPQKVLTRCIEALIQRGLVHAFDHQNRRYVYQRDWQDWQKVTWPARTIQPKPPELDMEQCSPATRVLFEVHPGGKKIPSKKSASAPRALSSENRSTSEVLPSTREGLMAMAKANGSGGGETPQPDVWLQEFLTAYPKQGQCAGYLVQSAFFDVVGTDRAKFDGLMGRLARHKGSARWLQEDGRYIPRADKYLSAGTHLQEMPPPRADKAASSRLPEWAR